MYGLIPTTMVLAIGLTAAAFMVTIFHLGAGFLLLLAALGDAAFYLLALHAAIALPAAVFGGVLIAASGPRTSDERPQPVQALTLTVIATLLAVVLVGWVAPAGHRASSAALARFQDRPAAAPPQSAAALDLEQLLADGSPAARQELRARGRVVAPCLVLGLVAALLVASPLAWRASLALAATALVFVWQMMHLISRYEL